MAEIVTEIAYVPLKPGVDLESGEGKTIWDATLKTVSEQQEFRQLRWGMQIENPRVASLAVGKFSCLPYTPMNVTSKRETIETRS